MKVCKLLKNVSALVMVGARKARHDIRGALAVRRFKRTGKVSTQRLAK